MKSRVHPSYHPLSRILHWLIAIAIGLNFWLAERAEHLKEQALDLQALATLANHKSVGMTIFVLALLRLAWRQYAIRPMLPRMPAWQLLAANATHYLMYIVMIGLPLTGWLGSSASAYSVSWFNLFAIPDLVNVNETLAEQLFELHELLWIALQVLLLVHVLAALKHGLYNGDGVFSSMWSGRVFLGSLMLVVVLSAVVWQLQQSLSGPDAEVQSDSSFDEAEVTATDLELMTKRWQLQTADIQPWAIDHLQSRLSFQANQAGAEFTGRFERWQGRIIWSADDLDVAGMDVSIELSSVDSEDDERDGYLRDVEFFSVQQFPRARFLATWVRANNGLAQAGDEQSGLGDYAYVAEGYLQMKALIRPVQLWFNVEVFDIENDAVAAQNGTGQGALPTVSSVQQSQRLHLQGKAILNRHRWNIGEGQWADNAWIGADVMVRVDVVTE